MTFLTATLAVSLGTLTGNLLFFYILGTITRYNEYRKNRLIVEQFQEAQAQFADAIAKENDRMAKYAKLEGYSN
jgi:hypothetical protein